jgi:hypothetical protein
LTMNPVMALGMKQNAVLGTSGTALHTGDAVMKAPPVIRVIFVLH